jgi:hypothetical protein
MADLITERQQFENSLLNLLSNITAGGSGEIPAARLTLIDLVKAKLDEIIPAVSLSLDEDEAIEDPYSLLINSFLDESAKRVLLSAPAHVLVPTPGTVEATQDVTDNKIGYIILPDNFLRAISLRMSEWKRDVTEFMTQSDKRYRLQQNKYTRGGTAKPVAVLGHKKTGGSARRVIEYYSVNTSHVIEYFFYIPQTDAEDLQSNLTDALTWTCAGMILQVTERGDLAKYAFEQAGACYQNL